MKLFILFLPNVLAIQAAVRVVQNYPYIPGTIQSRRNSLCLKSPVCTLHYAVTFLCRKSPATFPTSFPLPALIMKSKEKNELYSLECMYFPRIFRIWCGLHYCRCYCYYYYYIMSITVSSLSFHVFFWGILKPGKDLMQNIFYYSLFRIRGERRFLTWLARRTQRNSLWK